MVSSGAESGFSCRARSKANSASDVCFAKSRALPMEVKNSAVGGELVLHFRQHAITSDDEWRGTMFHSGIDIGDAEISLLQIRRRLAPCGNVDYPREVLVAGSGRRWILWSVKAVCPPSLASRRGMWQPMQLLSLAGCDSRETSPCGRKGIWIGRTALVPAAYCADHGRFRTTTGPCSCGRRYSSRVAPHG